MRLNDRERLADLVSPGLVGLGLGVWGVEILSRRRGSLLRIYVHGRGRRIGSDDCVGAHRLIEPLLRVEGLLGKFDSLEISSPGVEPRLFTWQQMNEFQGAPVRLRSRVRFSEESPEKSLTGILIEASPETLKVSSQGKQYEIAVNNVLHCRVLPAGGG